MLRAQDLVEHLVRLGLPPPDASAYVQLAVMGTADVGAFARACSFDVAEAGRVLDALVRKGLAIPIGGGRAFAPTPPEEVRARLDQPPAQIRILRGRHEGEALAAQMIRRARRSVHFLNTSHVAVEVAQLVGTYQAGLERATGGLRIVGAVTTTRESRALLAALLRRPQVEIFHVETERPMRALVIDEHEAYAGLATDNAPTADAAGDLSLWTVAPDFVQAQLALIETFMREGRRVRDMLADDRSKL